MNSGAERWVELCRQASQETDPDRLLELVREIDHILEAREKGWNHGRRRVPSA